MQQQIYNVLKARDPEFTLAGYSLRDWLPPYGEISIAPPPAQPTAEAEGQISMEHKYLNSSANL